MMFPQAWEVLTSVMPQEAGRLGGGGMLGMPEPEEPGKGIRKAPAASLGTRWRPEERHQAPMAHSTPLSGVVWSLPRKTSGLDRFGKSPGREFVQRKVRRALWETGQIGTDGGKVCVGCQRPPQQASARVKESWERGENKDHPLHPQEPHTFLGQTHHKMP